MKLTSKQLRTLIESVIKENAPGAGNIDIEIDDAVQSVVMTVASLMEEMYDPNDPVMGEYGEQAWNDQVMGASSDLETRLKQVVDEVISNLHNGEYA